jgi:uncharacterized OB-fold protein
MICPNCGAQVNDSTRFCVRCGADVNDPKAPGLPKITAKETAREKSRAYDEALEEEMIAYARAEAEKAIAKGKNPNRVAIGLKVFGKAYLRKAKKNHFRNMVWRVAIFAVAITLLFVKNLVLPADVRLTDKYVQIDFSASPWQWERVSDRSYPAFKETDSGDILVMTDSIRLGTLGAPDFEEAEYEKIMRRSLKEELSPAQKYNRDEGYLPVEDSDRLYKTEAGSYVYVQTYSLTGGDVDKPYCEAVATINPARDHVAVFATVLDEANRKDADIFLNHIIYILENNTENR